MKWLIDSAKHSGRVFVTKSKIENAVVLAAGLGTRMRPITDTIPKPLVSVNGKALLDHALDALAAANVTHAAINVHYLADLIELHTLKRSVPRCVISDERTKLLDSGGGVKRALGELSTLGKNSDFVILNADSFWVDGEHSNLAAMLDMWNPESMDMLLLVTSKQNAIGFEGQGDFFMDHRGLLTRRGEVQNAPYVYAGAIVAKAEKLKAFGEEKFSLNALFDEAISSQRLFGCELSGLWLHVGTPEAISEAEFAIARHQHMS